MSSSRLPGKVLREFRELPILMLQIEKLRASTVGTHIVVATSDQPSDLPIVKWCEAAGISCTQGPLSEVANRIAAVLTRFKPELFVRFCADRPYYDWRILDAAVALMEERTVDLVSNAFPPSFPKGQMTEVVRSSAFLAALPEIRSAYDQEHVTSFFYAHPERFRIANISSGDPAWHEVNLALDTEDDWLVFQKVMAGLERPHTEYTWIEFAELVRQAKAIEAA